MTGLSFLHTWISIELLKISRSDSDLNGCDLLELVESALESLLNFVSDFVDVSDIRDTIHDGLDSNQIRNQEKKDGDVFDGDDG